ncbi:MAG: hypothetical protein L6R41_006407 [Letrouitia leprolyta]|nr:MAG: hypothetical protein L6R41_006407 [Letrouitia leprolyta]
MGSGRWDSYRPSTNNQVARRDENINNYQKPDGSHLSRDVQRSPHSHDHHDHLAINGRVAYDNRQDTHRDPGDRLAGTSSGIKPPRLDSSASNRKASMMSPSESPLTDNLPNASGKSLSQPPTPAVDTVPSSDSNLPSDIRSSMQAFMESIVATAVEQVRYEALKREEQQQRDEQTRWSSYSGNFPSLSEDQSRILKATQNTIERSQKYLTQQRQKGGNAAKDIARSLNTVIRAPDTDIDTVIKRLENTVNDQGEAIKVLQRENQSLKDSAAADTKSRHYQVEKQRRQEQELSRLQDKYNQKISDLVTQSKAFTNFTSRQDQINQDYSRFQDSHVAMKSEFISELQNIKDSLKQSQYSHEAISATLKELKGDLESSKQDSNALQEMRIQMQETTNNFEERVQHISSNQSTVKSVLEQLEEQSTKNASEIAQTLKERQELSDEFKKLKIRQSSMENDKTGSQPDITSYIEDYRQIQEEQQSQKAQLNAVVHTFEEYRLGQSEGIANVYPVGVQTITRQEYDELCKQRDEAILDTIEGIHKRMEEINDVVTADSSNGDQRAVNEQLRSEISDLQRRFDSILQEFKQLTLPPPPPPPPPPPCCVKEEVEPKVVALDSEIQDLKNDKHALTDKVRAVETFQATYESRWNNLTTEKMVSGIMFHLQRPLYTIHTLQNDLNQMKQQHGQSDARMNQLSDSVQKVAQDLSRIERAAGEAGDRAHSAVAAATATETRMQESLEREDTQKRESYEFSRQALSSARGIKDELERLKTNHDFEMAKTRSLEEKCASDEAKFQAYDATIAALNSKIEKEFHPLQTIYNATIATKPAIDEKFRLMQTMCEDIKATEEKISKQLEQVTNKHDEVDGQYRSVLAWHNASLTAREEINDKVEEFRTKYDALATRDTNGKSDSSHPRPDIPNATIQSLNSKSQQMQNGVDGAVLGLQAENAKLREYFNGLREDMMAETRNLSRKIETTNSNISGDGQLKNPNLHINISKAQDNEGSDSDAPIIGRGKYSHGQASESANKKRKINPLSDDESYNERSTPKSARSKKKTESINGHTDKPSPKRGRPRKTAPID